MFRPLSVTCLSAVLLASSYAFALPPQEVIDAINNRQQLIQQKVTAANSVDTSPGKVVDVPASRPRVVSPVSQAPALQSRPVAAITNTAQSKPQMLAEAVNTVVSRPAPVSRTGSAPNLQDEPVKPFKPTRIVLDNKNWGGASTQDVQAVLDSTVEAITPYMSFHSLGNILIRHGQGVPVSQYEKGPHGEYIIELSASGNHWAQYVYQFSHEMCHLISNYDLAPNNASRQQWMDESLCDAFSLFTLQQMEAQWKTKPPYPNWKEYAPNFAQYAEDELNQPHRKLPTGVKVSEWVAKHQQELSADPYAEGRHLNEVVGKQLLQVFSAKPENWAALNFLNLGDDSQDKSLDKFLNDWEDNTPSDMKGTVDTIQDLLESGKQ